MAVSTIISQIIQAIETAGTSKVYKNVSQPTLWASGSLETEHGFSFELTGDKANLVSCVTESFTLKITLANLATQPLIDQQVLLLDDLDIISSAITGVSGISSKISWNLGSKSEHLFIEMNLTIIDLT